MTLSKVVVEGGALNMKTIVHPYLIVFTHSGSVAGLTTHINSSSIVIN